MKEILDRLFKLECKVSNLIRHGSSGGGTTTVTATTIYNETPNTTNNVDFNTTNTFVPETVQIFVNGLSQKIITDYQITSSSTIQLNFILQLTELLTINYQKI